MDRLISENKVLEAIDNLKANFTCYDSVTLDEVASHVKAIPSAEPKTGHWIRVTDKTGHLVWECDRCGWQQKFNTNYCPDCGAKMVEPICDTCEYTTAAFNPCNACKDKSEYKPMEGSEKE